MWKFDDNNKTLTLDFTVPLDLLTKGVVRASLFAAIGERARKDEGFTSARLDEGFPFLFVEDPLSEARSKLARSEFAAWTFGNCLTHLDQAMGLFLDRMFILHQLLTVQGTPIDIPAYNRFERKSVTAKMDEVLGWITVDRQEIPSFLGLTSVRNVLTHHLGIVRPSDCKDGILTVEWQHFEVLFNGEVVEFTGPAIGPLEVDTEVSVRLATRRREHREGDAVTFSALDVSQLCFTYHRTGVLIGKALEQFALSKGVKPPPTGNEKGGAEAPPA